MALLYLHAAYDQSLSERARILSEGMSYQASTTYIGMLIRSSTVLIELSRDVVRLHLPWCTAGIPPVVLLGLGRQAAAPCNRVMVGVTV